MVAMQITVVATGFESKPAAAQPAVSGVGTVQTPDPVVGQQSEAAKPTADAQVKTAESDKDYFEDIMTLLKNRK